MRKSICIPALATACCLILAWAPRLTGAQEYTARASIQHSYSDEQILSSPTAHVQADTSPGSVWIKYDVTTDSGSIDGWHQLYSCCVSNSSTYGEILMEDVLFSTPNGTGGTATATLNLFVEGNTGSGPCSGFLHVDLKVQGGFMDCGFWSACGNSYASSGMFAGHNDPTIAEVLPTPQFTVPLDTPFSFSVVAAGATGSYQQVVTMDTRVSFPEFGSGIPVFNILSTSYADTAMTDSITVSSRHGDIADNHWGGGSSVAVGDDPEPGRFLLGPVNPNPSRGLAAFELALPHQAAVQAWVFDLQGRLVATVFEGSLPEGRHQLAWDPAQGVSSGVYFVKTRALGETQSRRVVLVR